MQGGPTTCQARPLPAQRARCLGCACAAVPTCGGARASVPGPLQSKWPQQLRPPGLHECLNMKLRSVHGQAGRSLRALRMVRDALATVRTGRERRPKFGRNRSNLADVDRIWRISTKLGSKKGKQISKHGPKFVEIGRSWSEWTTSGRKRTKFGRIRLKLTQIWPVWVRCGPSFPDAGSEVVATG